jgi:hypothetical protein
MKVELEHPVESARPTFFQRPDQVPHPLYVVTPIFNSSRYRSRWRLYDDFAKRVHEAGAHLYTAEAAFGEREWAVTDPSWPNHLQLRTGHELWLKENLINVMVSRLPRDWKYVAWIDADVRFARDDWANETVHRLQHFDFVQMWSQFQDLSPKHEIVGQNTSFMSVWQSGAPRRCSGDYPYYGRRGYPGAPGLAWACTRRAWDAVGGLIDWSILGACDWFMAHALVGELDRVMKPDYPAAYTEPMYQWQARAELHIKRNVGAMDGLALHEWHGPKVARKYGTRDQILVQTQFNPTSDLKRDWQGLYQLETEPWNLRQIALRDRIRRYFHERDEDA